MKFRRPSAALALVVLGSAVRAAAADPLDALVQDSPFGAAPAPAAAEPTAAGPEFRSYFIEGAEQVFSVYDPSSQRSFWLRRGEKGGLLVIRGFDLAAERLDVEYRSQRMQLGLQRAVLKSSGPGPVAAVAEAAPVSGAATVPEEVRRAELNLARAKQRILLESRKKREAAAPPGASRGK